MTSGNKMYVLMKDHFTSILSLRPRRKKPQSETMEGIYATFLKE